MSNITTGKSSHRNDSYRTTTRELYSFFVNFSQIRIQRTRHRILRRNLIHTVRHNSQRIGIRSHIGQQYQYFLVMFYGKIFSRSQCHIWNQQTFYRRVFCRIHKADDTVQRTCIREYILKVEVVIVCHTHTTQNNLVCLCTQSYVRHYLVKRLVRVCKERNLLPGYQRIVQVDTGNTRSNQFRRLFTTYRIH